MNRREFLGLVFGGSVALLGGALCLAQRDRDGVSLVSTSHPGVDYTIVDETEEPCLYGFGPVDGYDYTDFSTETMEVVVHEVHGGPLFPFEDRAIRRYG